MNDEESVPYINISTRIYASILGVIVGLSGIIHGFYEALQGNKATEGFYLDSVGAVTLLPNYLVTGIVAITTSIFIIVWMIGYVQRKDGPIIFLISCVILFFVGGGVAQVVVFLIAWIVSTQIRSPLLGWEKVIPLPIRGKVAKLWLPVLALAVIFILSGLFIWLYVLPPGEIREITSTHYLLWSLLLIGAFLLTIDIVLGFARDIEIRER